LKVSVILRIALIIEIIALLITTAAVSRDYQDSWILTGLEIPFIVVAITYTIYFFSERDSNITWIIAFALVFRSVILLVPNLKYVWFQGVGFDQHNHFRLIQDIQDKGHIPTGYSYSGTPFMHLLSAIYSIITGFSNLFAFKYLPVMSWFLYPLVIYVIVKQVAPKTSSLQKYAILASSVPVEPTLSWVVVGTTFGALLTILLLSQLIKILQVNKRNYCVIALIYGFALISAHSYSATILTIGLLITYLASKSNFVKNRLELFDLGIPIKAFIIFLVVVGMAWLMFSATTFFLNATQIVQQWTSAILGNAPTTGRSFTDIQWSFFGLNLENQLRLVVVYYGGILFMLFLTLLGIIIVIKKSRPSIILNFFSVFLLSVWSFFIIQLLASSASAGLFEYNRLFEFSYSLTPVFIGILLYYLQKKLRSIKLNYFIVCLLIGLATVQLYGCQPLLPIASSVRSNLPSDEYIIYVGTVNSAYQRYMIAYAEEHIGKGMIACDPVTRNQILGLADYDFSQSHLSGRYPFEGNITEETFDYFLIHLPGKSGQLGVKPEVGTRDFIFGVIRNSSMIYSNGESYILTSPFVFYSKKTDQ